jgi:hypothetical protein
LILELLVDSAACRVSNSRINIGTLVAALTALLIALLGIAVSDARGA